VARDDLSRLPLDVSFSVVTGSIPPKCHSGYFDN
jgi:hypothetical protein